MRAADVWYRVAARRAVDRKEPPGSFRPPPRTTAEQNWFTEGGHIFCRTGMVLRDTTATKKGAHREQPEPAAASGR